MAGQCQSTLGLQAGRSLASVDDIDLLVNIRFVLETLDEAVFDFNETIVLDNEACHGGRLKSNLLSVTSGSLVHHSAILRDAWPRVLRRIQLQHGH